MSTRRNFVKTTALGGLLSSTVLSACAENSEADTAVKPVNKPVVISTWNHGIAANEGAWTILSESGSALDAVEAGVRITESDPNVRTVGIGGFPDREGHVTLDACIMNPAGDCGSVAFLQHIKNPISVARKVMEDTPHVMLAGKGALDFALSKGFEKENLLTEESKADWEAWLEEGDKDAKAIINVENHDTIGMLALDENGDMAGACTTSGASWKLHGRIGDSPIIGAGLFVDNEVGGACATGWGEAVIRVVGCHLVVEFMRQGNSPEDACRLAVERVISKNPDYKDIQVGFLALNKNGKYGSYCIQPGFQYAIQDKAGGNQLFDAKSRL